VVLGCDKLDDGRSEDEEATCFLAERVNVLRTRPAFYEITVAPVFGDACQPGPQEEPDIAVH